MDAPRPLGPYFRLIKATDAEIIIGFMQNGRLSKLHFRREIGLAAFQLSNGETVSAGNLPLYYFKANVSSQAPGIWGDLDNRQNLSTDLAAQATFTVKSFQDPFNTTHILIKHSTHLSRISDGELSALVLDTHYALHSDGNMYIFTQLHHRNDHDLNINSINLGLFFGSSAKVNYNNLDFGASFAGIGIQGNLSDEFTAVSHNASVINFPGQFVATGNITNQPNEPPYNLLTGVIIPIFVTGPHTWKFAGCVPIGGLGMINPEFTSENDYGDYISLIADDYLAHPPFPSIAVLPGSTLINNDEGDINADGFNEGRGYFVLQANNGQVSWILNPNRGGPQQVLYKRPKFKIRAFIGFDC